MKFRMTIMLTALIISFQSVGLVGAAEIPTEVWESLTEKSHKELTLEAALEKAKEHSTDLRSVEDRDEYLQKLKEDVWDTEGHFNVPNTTYQKWVNDWTYSINSNIQSINSNMAKNSYNEEITKIALVASVKSSFTSILSDESTLSLAKRTEDVQKILYQQGEAKYELGIISEYDLRELRNSYKTAQDNVCSLEKTLSQEYRTLYQLIGEEENAQYTLVYETEYKPYTMEQTMEQYVNDRLKNDYTIKQQEQALEDAKFSTYYLSESTTNTQNLTNQYNYDEAKRSLKTEKENKEMAIKNAYDAILKLEDSYISAENTLETANSKLVLAELNFELGKSTELDRKQAELALEQAEDNLQQIVYAHDIQIYQFENTELLSTSGGISG